MRPRTRLQKEVLRMSGRLEDRTAEVKRWAAERCLDHVGYATRTRVVCMDCGGRFGTDAVRRRRAVCPHCGAKLKVEETRRWVLSQRCYVARAEVVRGTGEWEATEFQVARYFEVDGSHREGQRARYGCREVLQVWVSDAGKVVKVGLRHEVYYRDAWMGCMEVRTERTGGGYRPYVDRYDVVPWAWHPGSEWSERWRRYGIDGKLRGLSFLDACETVPRYPKAETLVKAGQYGLLAYCCNTHIGKLDYYWPSIKICLRRKYRPKDAGMWCDYVDLLMYFGKDVRNAHYVCPKDLKKEHDRLADRKRKRLAAERLEDERRRAKRDEEEFGRFIGRFAGLSFGDGEIWVRPLESVEEFMLEGDAMHHCVFVNGYYKKRDCLILTARNAAGERIETVEVSLKSLRVVQSRGRCNENTAWHDRIVGLVERNMKQIGRRMAGD